MHNLAKLLLVQIHVLHGLCTVIPKDKTYHFQDGWVAAHNERKPSKPGNAMGNTHGQFFVKVLGTSLQSEEQFLCFHRHP